MGGFDTFLTRLVPTEKINLGSTSFQIPVSRLRGAGAGKKLLITAGVDGDEYAGMEAAYRLISEFSKTPFYGELTIIPIVNMPGFNANTNRNPMDDKFPKYIYPGRETGTSTEQLCWWLSQFARRSDFWLDLHGGTLNEVIVPFIESWKSGNKTIDDLVASIVATMHVRFATSEPVRSKTKILAEHGCGYLLAESGELGKIDEKAVTQHVTWAHQVMGSLKMIEMDLPLHPKQIFQRVTEYSSHHDGYWHARYTSCVEVHRGDELGAITSRGGSVFETITVKEDGRLLWLNTGSLVRRGDIVAGVGII